MLICFCFTFSFHSPPRVYALSFAHRTSTTTERGFLSQLHTNTLFYILLIPLFPCLCSTYTWTTFPTHTITVFTTQFSPFPSEAHNSTAPLPSFSPSTPTSNTTTAFHIKRIPIPVINKFKRASMFLFQFTCPCQKPIIDPSEIAARLTNKTHTHTHIHTHTYTHTRARALALLTGELIDWNSRIAIVPNTLKNQNTFWLVMDS